MIKNALNNSTVNKYSIGISIVYFMFYILMVLALTDAVSLTSMHSGKFYGLEGSFIGCLIFVIIVPIFAGVCFYTWACGWGKNFSWLCFTNFLATILNIMVIWTAFNLVDNISKFQ